MAHKIENVGNGFIKFAENTLINLKGYSEIRKHIFSLSEVDGVRFGIEVTPLTPSKRDIENGVNGAGFLNTYQKSEEKQWEADFEIIMEALKDK